MRRSCARTRESLERFSSSFGPQKSRRDFGGRPILHPCACQKHPLTKMTLRRDGKTMSGLPGKSRRYNRYRYRSAERIRRTSSSGAVSFPPIRAINALRLSFVLLSAINGKLIDRKRDELQYHVRIYDRSRANQPHSQEGCGRSVYELSELGEPSAVRDAREPV